MLNSKEAREIVKNGFNVESMNHVQQFGTDINKNGLTTSQIRHVFTKIKEIEAKGIDKMEADLIMLKPLTAYSSKRHNKAGLTSFKDTIIDSGIEEVMSTNDKDERRKKFNNFVKLIEAVLAYHKAAGGK
ncbi:MAG TPA: type III-A CRISPR-associated protein Csm2 [Spirochaetota bacterium]|nr:type III-A CRISPR-associated protein Csm2 [Spirochaetota bacterium]